MSGRGSLPFALVHGESLVAAASWALGEAGVDLFDYDTPLERLRDSGRSLVLHDPLCPLTPVDFIVEAVEESQRSGAVVVGVRPVTDTVKEYDGHHVGRTWDRADLVSVCSPVVLPPMVLAGLDDLGGEGGDSDADLVALVDRLRAHVPMRFLPAPALARRVVHEDDLALLEALSSGESG